MSKRRAPKRFQASKEVKRRARLQVGQPPPSRTHGSRKQKPPKHKKREVEMEEQ